MYNVPEALNPNVLGDGAVFLNDPRVRKALHAPISKDWAMTFLGVFDGNPEGMCSRLSIVICCYGWANYRCFIVAADPSEFRTAFVSL